MLVGCFEISIFVIVKHVQHVGIIMNFCLLGRTFWVEKFLGEKIVGFWFAMGVSVSMITL